MKQRNSLKMQRLLILSMHSLGPSCHRVRPSLDVHPSQWVSSTAGEFEVQTKWERLPQNHAVTLQRRLPIFSRCLRRRRTSHKRDTASKYSLHSHKHNWSYHSTVVSFVQAAPAC